MKIKLVSGKELDITLAPFEDSKSLYAACAEEVKGLKVDPDQSVDINFLKDIFLTGIFSKKIEQALVKCMSRATYAGLKIDKDTFEEEEARGDYMQVCFEVARANISPFTKNLSALWSDIKKVIPKDILA